MLGLKNKEIPTEKVLDMQKQGLGSQEIISNLQNLGYKHEQIASAMDQATVKNEISNMGPPEQPALEGDVPLALMNAPAPSNSQEEPASQQDYPPMEYAPTDQTAGFAPEPLERASYDAIEEIAESIIKEKWSEMVRSVGDITQWKERTDLDLENVKQELIRTQQKFDDLQKALIGKVSEYSEGIIHLGTEMKALEKVLEKILAPLTKSVKDLQIVSEKLATRKRAAPRKKKKK
jgi:hypothetical protein